MIKLPTLGKITQGTIFCGAVAEDYLEKPVWGLIITARCDTVHEKVPIVNYLPIVRAEDWADQHGAYILAERQHSEICNRFKALLTKKKLSESLLQVHSYVEIAAKHFPRSNNPLSKKDHAENKDAELAYELAKKLTSAEQLLSTSKASFKRAADLHENGAQLAQRLFQELIAGQLAGYYYVPEMPEKTELASDLGHVVLLREIHHLPRIAAKQLAQGIDDEFLKSNKVAALNCSSFELIYPVAELIPPWTEHLMQSFCNLFGRIGVADPDKTKAASMASTLLK